MNCLDFRRRSLTDPYAKDDQLVAHETACAECAEFARDLRAQEVRLRAVLQEVSPPEGLAERIQLAARFEHRAELGRRWWYGAAASVLLIVGVSLVSVVNTVSERSGVALAQSVLYHIDDESHHLRETQPVSAGRLHRVFERFGARLVSDVGRVNFAAECLMRHRNGVHLVMPGRVGPITVFFMPGEMTDEPLPVRSERFAGKVVPTSWGSVAVVGERGENLGDLGNLGERLAAAVDWPAQTSPDHASSVIPGSSAAPWLRKRRMVERH